MDDYAALVDRTTMQPTFFDTAITGPSYGKPYWTTEGGSDTCWSSLDEARAVAVLDTRTKQEGSATSRSASTHSGSGRRRPGVRRRCRPVLTVWPDPAAVVTERQRH